MADVTTGNELNQYEGNAALAAGSSTGGGPEGFSAYNISPLQTFALQSYNKKLQEYEKQQEDKKALEEQFFDPKLYQFLDKGLADQLAPEMDEFMNMAKQNVQLRPNSEDWYKVHDMHQKLVAKNAQAKTVQTLKNQFKVKAGESKDEHEKEKILKYVAQLDAHKLGTEVPAYTGYIAVNKGHLPPTEVVKGIKARLNGNAEETVEYTVNYARGLDKKARLQRVANPEVFATGEGIGHSIVEHGGLEEINKAALVAYDNSLLYGLQDLKKKNADAIAAYQKLNPKATDREALIAIGQGTELDNIYAEHEFLIGAKDKASSKGAIEYIPVKPGEPVLDNYTYTPDGKFRLSQDNDAVRGIFAATQTPIGAAEKVIESKISTKGAEIKLKEAQVGTANATTQLRKAQTATQGTIQEKNRATTKNLEKATEAITLPPSIVPDIAQNGKIKQVETTRVDTKKDGSKYTIRTKEPQIIVNFDEVPETIRKTAGLINKIEKPEKTGDPKKDERAFSAYNKAIAQNGDGEHQMRFYDKNGNDKTLNVINKINTEKLTIGTFSNQASQAGYTIKFIDKSGKIVGTTNSVDRETLKENNKSTSKGDAVIGTVLPTDNEPVVEEY